MESRFTKRCYHKLVTVYCDMCDTKIGKDDESFECLDCGDLLCFECVDMGNIGRHCLEDED